MNRLTKALFDIGGEPIPEYPLNRLYKETLSIAWPSIVEGALISIISSVDTMMVGSLGSSAIAAVGLCSQPRMILLVLAQALCVGTTALIARRKGEGNQASANSVLQQSLAIITFVGILIALLGYFCAEPILRLAGANEDTIVMSSTYFRIISCALPCSCWTLCICAAMRAIGKTRITMVTNIVANLVNVCLNYCLINGNLGFPRMEVAGAALATAIGTCVSAIVAIIFASLPSGYLHIRLRHFFHFDRETVNGLMKVGSSSIAETVFLRVGFLINSRLVAGLGTANFAIFQVVSQVSSLSFTVGDGIAVAGTALVGQRLGAKRPDLAKAQVRITRKLSIISAIFLMVTITLLRYPIASLFSTEADIISGASVGFMVIVAGMIFQNGRIVYSGCLRGAGDVKFVAFASLVSVLVMRPILTYLLCYPLNNLMPWAMLAVTGPWLSFVVDSIVRNSLLLHRINQGKWVLIKL